MVKDVRNKAEAELYLQKSYFEELFNSAPEAIVWHDTNDIVFNVNREFTRMFGYTAEEAIGKPINELVAPLHLIDEASHFSDKVIHGEKVEADSVRRRKDGSLIDVWILGAPIFHEGKQLGVYAIYRDITERRKATEQLIIQKTYLENLFNNAPEAIVWHDDNDIVVDVNEEFTRMFGYSRDEAKGKPINSLVVPKNMLNEANRFSNNVIHGKRVEADSVRRRKDGSLIDVWIIGAPIFHQNKQIGVYAIYRDITERKLATQELILQKTYLEGLFNSAPEAIVWHDENDVIIDVNVEFTRMFGYSREEARGKPINSLVAPKELVDEAETFSNMVINGKRVEADSVRRRKDGSMIDVWILGAPIFNKDEQIGVYAIYRDITERKKAEEIRIGAIKEAKMAREIQLNLLPKNVPEIPGYDISGISIPAENVGGDYFDFIQINEEKIAICLGDVSGKGLPAALVMSNLQATIRTHACFNTNAEECLRGANKLLLASTDSKTFVTLFYGILDPGTNILTYSNAGQNTPFILSTDGLLKPLETHGLPLGVVKETTYPIDFVKLEPGDQLLIYSDGVTEAMNEKRELFGDHLLPKIIYNNRSNSSEEVIDKIIKEIRRHTGNASQNDDITMVLLSRSREYAVR